ncbi:hypothetical protein [Bradyrhizobium sp. CCBAU 11357]|uniref:hypothetical protein n=1 Tax=Bradyrhizobium sp. CCBAU 11357 TaxID=1630808 RepID=UPI00230259BA|nr:hypothetical protein [Bradyrhizobium sp. CCBAU 11357]
MNFGAARVVEITSLDLQFNFSSMTSGCSTAGQNALTQFTSLNVDGSQDHLLAGRSTGKNFRRWNATCAILRMSPSRRQRSRADSGARNRRSEQWNRLMDL